MATVTYHSQALFNAQLVTRDDLPGVGVIQVVWGLCLLVRVDEQALSIIPDDQVDIAAQLAQVFPSPEAAFDYLRHQGA